MFGLLQTILPIHYPFLSACKSVEKIIVPNHGVLWNEEEEVASLVYILQSAFITRKFPEVR
jgi:hypothetical protein